MLAKFKFVRALVMVGAIIATLGWTGRGLADNFQDFPDDRRDAIAAAIALVPDDAGVCYDDSGSPDSIEIWNFQTQVYVGPIDVTSTLDRIRLGYWISTNQRHDGGLFNLREGELPNVPRMGDDYYREFYVWPAMDLDTGTYDRAALLFDDQVAFPGPMRILLGTFGEVYFTGDHYGQESPPPGLPAYYVNPTGP
jgi:hypothetical protein